MESEQDSTSGEAPRAADSRAAALLRDAREEQGLSLADIAARTRIPIRQLKVIESGAFASLPSRTYAIGFARTYARALDLDEDKVMAAVRAELDDAPEQRTPTTATMEPGDPAKLPSKGLAWAGAIAGLLLAAGLFAWFSNHFGAGRGAPPLAVEAEPAPPAEEAEEPVAAPAAEGGEVVITALADGIWVRLFEQSGERLLEKTLAKGESFTVPSTAADPRINTARPDALAITIDGKPTAPLAQRSVVLASEPVSAAALSARLLAPAAPAAPATSAPAATRTAAPVAAENAPAVVRPAPARTPPAEPDAQPAAGPEAVPAPAPPRAAPADGDE